MSNTPGDMSHTPQEKIRPKPLTPLSGGQMSLSLKNKLKRCGRYHTSTPAKKMCPNTLTIDSSPILPSQPLEVSNISGESLQLKQNDSLSVICEAQETNSPVSSDSLSRPKSVAGHVSSSQSPAQVFYRSPFPLKRSGSSFVSPVNKTISVTPSSKRNRRLLIRSTKLNFDKSDMKTKDDETKGDGPKMNLSVGEESSSSQSCTTHLSDASLLMVENNKEIACYTHTPEKETLKRSSVLKSKTSCSDFSPQSQKLVTSKRTLLLEIKEKEETLRKLKMVKMYRSKNNLSHLQTLIDKWRDASQQSLQDLWRLLPEPKPSMSDLLQHLQIEQELVNFDPVEEDFT